MQKRLKMSQTSDDILKIWSIARHELLVWVNRSSAHTSAVVPLVASCGKHVKEQWTSAGNISAFCLRVCRFETVLETREEVSEGGAARALLRLSVA
jgi:hypothetical protein